MADYISRQAAIDALDTGLWGVEWDKALATAMLKDLPPSDAVEIVRCRDCKHNPNDTWFECPISHLPYKEDRWCWKGERKHE